MNLSTNGNKIQSCVCGCRQPYQTSFVYRYMFTRTIILSTKFYEIPFILLFYALLISYLKKKLSMLPTYSSYDWPGKSFLKTFWVFIVYNRQCVQTPYNRPSGRWRFPRRTDVDGRCCKSFESVVLWSRVKPEAKLDDN